MESRYLDANVREKDLFMSGEKLVAIISEASSIGYVIFKHNRVNLLFLFLFKRPIKELKISLDESTSHFSYPGAPIRLFISLVFKHRSNHVRINLRL